MTSFNDAEEQAMNIAGPNNHMMTKGQYECLIWKTLIG